MTKEINTTINKAKHNEVIFSMKDLKKPFLTANNIIVEYLEPQLKQKLAEMVKLLNPDIEGFVINPFTTSFTFTREQLKILKKEKEERLKVVETKVKKDTPVMIGEAKEYPEDMLEALKSACKLDKNIKRTWLMLMYKEGQESYLLVVDSMGNEKESIEFIGRKVTPYLNGKYIDMLSYKDSFGKDVVKDKKPFYEKKNSI